MSEKEAAKKNAQLLKELREERNDSVEHAKALLKEQAKVSKDIRKAIADAPKTVPEIAKIISLPSNETLWHLTALKKYDIVAESGMDGEYPMYEWVEEKKK